MTAELRYKLLFERKQIIQKKEADNKKLLKSLTDDLVKIKWAGRAREIRKNEYNITQLKNELVEAI